MKVQVGQPFLFYETEQFSYHWALNGFGLSDAILRNVYHDNAERVLRPLVNYSFVNLSGHSG